MGETMEFKKIDLGRDELNKKLDALFSDSKWVEDVDHSRELIDYLVSEWNVVVSFSGGEWLMKNDSLTLIYHKRLETFYWFHQFYGLEQFTVKEVPTDDLIFTILEKRKGIEYRNSIRQYFLDEGYKELKKVDYETFYIPIEQSVFSTYIWSPLSEALKGISKVAEGEKELDGSEKVIYETSFDYEGIRVKCSLVSNYRSLKEAKESGKSDPLYLKVEDKNEDGSEYDTGVPLDIERAKKLIKRLQQAVDYLEK